MATTELPGVRRGAGAAGLSRPRLFAAVMFALVFKAVAPGVAARAASAHLGFALGQGLGQSWAFWFAFAVCVGLALRSEPTPASRGDGLVAGECLAFGLLPEPWVGALTATVLALWLALSPSTGRRLRAAAMVLATITVNLFWGPLALHAFAMPIASADAWIVGRVLHTPVHANVVTMVRDGRLMSILPACTSVESASISLMMFAAVVRAVRPAPRASELAYLATVLILVVAVNDARLCTMARSISLFERVHGPAGWAAINLIITAIGLAGAALCVRREIAA
jgi:hypothetical protein